MEPYHWRPLSSGARYIIRNPRSDATDVDVPDQVATLRHLKSHTPIPVPSMLRFDPTLINPLVRPYTVQNWAGGRNLRELLDEGDLGSRMAIAKAVVQLMVKMYSTEYFHEAGAIRAQATASADSIVLGLPGPTEFAIRPPASIADALTFLTPYYDTDGDMALIMEGKLHEAAEGRCDRSTRQASFLKSLLHHAPGLRTT